MQIRASDYSVSTKIVLLGISDYQSRELNDLLSPGKDVWRLHQILASPNAGSVPEKNITVIEPIASKETVLTSVQQCIASSTSSDILIFYFAGHGLIRDNKFFLCLSCTSLEQLESTAISSAEIDTLFKQFPGRGLLFLLDCCRSAGFAELAPSFFSSLNEKDFKILLSASRSEQNSWELARESGTLFTKHLVRALSGEVLISRSSGLIYFTELFDHLSTQIEEDLTLHYPDLPRQQLVFAGVYNKDPLLFVHKDLTLRQVSVKTTRYSREYINRLIRNTAIGVLSFLLFALGILYSVLDKSQYAIVVSDRVHLYKGIHGVDMLGFPKKLWTLDIGANDLTEQSKLRSGVPLSSELGKEILPVVIHQCKIFRQVEYLFATGKRDSAKKLAFICLSQNPAAIENKLAILKELVSSIEPKDTALLIELFKKSEFSVTEKREIISLLARLSLPTAMQLSFNWPLNAVEDYYTQREILKNCDNANKADMQQYLGYLLRGNYVSNLIPFIFEAAIRQNVFVSENDVASLMKTLQFSDGVGLGYEMKLMNGGAIKKMLEDFLLTTHHKIVAQTEHANWEAVNFALTALTAYGDTVSLCSELQDFAINSQSNESLRLLLDVCPAYRLQFKNNIPLIAQYFSLSPYMIEELAKYKLIPFSFIKAAFDSLKTPYHREKLIHAMQSLGDTTATNLLINQIAFRESDLLPSTRVAAIEALSSMKVPYSRAKSIIPNDWEDVTIAALKWQNATDPRGVQGKIISLITQKDKLRTLSNVLVEIKPSEKTMEEARKRSKKTGDEKLNALGILAMYGSGEEVVSLLKSDDIETRSTVASLVAFNTKFKTIVEKMNASPPKFPNEAIASINEQFHILSEFDHLIQRLPRSREAMQWASYTVEEKYKEETTDGLFFYFEKKQTAFEKHEQQYYWGDLIIKLTDAVKICHKLDYLLWKVTYQKEMDKKKLN